MNPVSSRISPSRNIRNLTTLWKQMDTCPLPEGTPQALHHSLHWPHRLWLDWGFAPSDIDALLAHAQTLTPPGIVPVWDAHDPGNAPLIEGLHAQGFSPLFEQTAMVLDLTQRRDIPSAPLHTPCVDSPHDLTLWRDTASSAFGYEIDLDSLIPLIDVPECHLLLLKRDETPLATALLYLAEGVAGVHLVGVPKAHRRQGLAERIMRDLLGYCREVGVAHVTLQASNLGLGIYERLGFASQCLIRNFMRSAP